MILYGIFETKKNGFYIDVGAHHPKRFLLRKCYIDAMSGSMQFFAKSRPRDNNIEIVVALKAGYLENCVFNEPVLNGFSTDFTHERKEKMMDIQAKK